MIEYSDLERLITEVEENLGQHEENQEIQTWLDKEEITNEAFDKLTDMFLSIAFKSIRSADVPGTDLTIGVATQELPRDIAASIAMAFVTGWEAHKQYGKKERVFVS